MVRSEINIYDLGILTLREAIRHGADEAEVYIVKTKEIESTIQNNKITEMTTSRDGGISLRVSIGKKLGFASTNKLISNELGKLAEKAVAIAKASNEDKDWPGFPPPQEYSTVKNIFSPQLAEIDEDTIIEKTKQLLENVLVDKRITMVYGGISVHRTSIAILNTNGLSNIQHLTASIVFTETLATEAGNTTPIVTLVDHSRTSIPSIGNLAKRAVEETLSCLKPVKIEPGNYPVIMTASAIESLFNYTLFEALKGDNVVRGRSPYRGRENEKIASENLTLIDDGTLNQGLFTALFDHEGISMKKKILIENGILKQFLFNHYWAKRYGGESTGNAMRSSYNSIPRISPTNILIKPGDTSFEEMIKETKKGLLVKGLQGAHSSNPETGEYSVVATPAWLIDNGAIKPVRNVMIAGNIYDELFRIDMIGRRTEKWIHVWTPPIRFSNIRVIPR